MKGAFGFFGKVRVFQNCLKVGVSAFFYEGETLFKGAFPGDQVIPGKSLAALHDLVNSVNMVKQEEGNEDHPEAHLRRFEHLSGEIEGKAFFIFQDDGFFFAELRQGHCLFPA